MIKNVRKRSMKEHWREISVNPEKSEAACNRLKVWTPKKSPDVIKLEVRWTKA